MFLVRYDVTGIIFTSSQALDIYIKHNFKMLTAIMFRLISAIFARPNQQYSTKSKITCIKFTCKYKFIKFLCLQKIANFLILNCFLIFQSVLQVFCS